MDPIQSPHARYPLALDSETTCYSPLLKVSVALQHVTSFPSASHALREVRQYITGLLSGQGRIHRAGWFI
jgi:hypothetical protein